MREMVTDSRQSHMADGRTIAVIWEWGQQELLLSGRTCLIVLQDNAVWGQLSAQEIMYQTFFEFDTGLQLPAGRSLE